MLVTKRINRKIRYEAGFNHLLSKTVQTSASNSLNSLWYLSRIRAHWKWLPMWSSIIFSRDHIEHPHIAQMDTKTVLTKSAKKMLWTFTSSERWVKRPSPQEHNNVTIRFYLIGIIAQQSYTRWALLSKTHIGRMCLASPTFMSHIWSMCPSITLFWDKILQIYYKPTYDKIHNKSQITILSLIPWFLDSWFVD